MKREPEFWAETAEGEGAFVEDPDGFYVRISNPDAENGHDETAGPLDWLNSARVTINPKHDEVTCSVSVGDPRGAFTFIVRRLTDGRILIHTPHPGETQHMDTKDIGRGTLVIVGYDGEPAHFLSDDDPEECIDCGGTNIEEHTCIDCQAEFLDEEEE